MFLSIRWLETDADVNARPITVAVPIRIAVTVVVRATVENHARQRRRDEHRRGRQVTTMIDRTGLVIIRHAFRGAAFV